MFVGSVNFRWHVYLAHWILLMWQRTKFHFVSYQWKVSSVTGLSVDIAGRLRRLAVRIEAREAVVQLLRGYLSVNRRQYCCRCVNAAVLKSHEHTTIPEYNDQLKGNTENGNFCVSRFSCAENKRPLKTSIHWECFGAEGRAYSVFLYVFGVFCF